MTHDSEGHDEAPQQIVRVNREIPLWGILTMLGLAVVPAVNTYYSNKAQGEQLAAVAADVRAIQSDVNKAVVQNAEVRFRLDDYLRRLQNLEANVITLQGARR